MVAVVQDIEVEQGFTFELIVEMLDEDGQTPRVLAGYTGTMQIRDSEDSTGTLLGTATVSIATGQVSATIAHGTTADYTWRVGNYDIAITNGTRREKIARGVARLTRYVTTT